MSWDNNTRDWELSDPRALRALAHPTRLAIRELLLREGSLTATQASRLLGESTASTSYHLRQLAKYGFIEPAEGGRGPRTPVASHGIESTMVRCLSRRGGDCRGDCALERPSGA